MRSQRYQTAMAILFALMWGFIVLDRQTLTYLFPTLEELYGYTNTQLGVIVTATSFGFAIFSIIFGITADRTGYKKRLLIPFSLLAAIFSGSTAFAGTITMIIVVRFLTGAGEGPCYPLMTSMLAAQSDQKNFAKYIGLLSVGSFAIAGIIGPTLVTQIAAATNWQMAYIFAALPALIVGIVIWVVVKEVKPEEVAMQQQDTTSQKMSGKDLIALLKNRNILLCVVMNILNNAAWWGLLSYAPIYWVYDGGLTSLTMGYLTSMFGAFGVVWAIVIPRISDRIGRKPATIMFGLASAVALFAMCLSAGTVAKVLYVILSGCSGYLLVMYTAVIAIESVPRKVAATASAVVLGVGEIIGATLSPAILGAVADASGLSTVFLISGLILVVSAIFGFFLKETHPKKKVGDTEELKESMEAIA
ncbi:MAG TPA: MFS transporter, partial [Anaerovoracaceae bacterium]|nr:MFS transporter [Anaerovoracaceae bacterium]